MSVYGPNTNFANERTYLNNLVSAGGGNAIWAKNQLNDLAYAEQKYSSASGHSPSSAASVLPSSVSGLLSGGLDGLLGVLTRTASQNSALSAQMAAEQRDWQERQNKLAMDFNSAEAAKSRDWQAMMSNTAHQREIKDLKLAGLNPVLSAMGGNGAAVTSGATASGVTSAGAKGEVDTSANAALVQVLGSVLSAQTQLQAANVSARTQEAVADKYTAMEHIVAQISADASKYGADVSKYAAGLSYASSKYATDQQILNPNGPWGFLRELIKAISGDIYSGVGLGPSGKNLSSSLFKDNALFSGTDESNKDTWHGRLNRWLAEGAQEISDSNKKKKK